ncbi:MAG TPA: DUF2127 domain-containing protein [Polyangia bacterium]|nr:DUF2127 domain-containing protein [Polyangia bacterium]
MVLVIGAFKIVKAVLLYLLAAGALLGLPEAVVQGGLRAAHWIGALSGHHAVMSAVGRVLAADDRTLHEIGAAALGYGVVFTVEGAGLLSRRPWAEWLTVFVTGTFIPFEVYEAARHPSVGKIGAIALNMAVVAYLVWRRLDHRQGSEP